MEIVSICHCLGLPHLPSTCGAQSPAVSWRSAPNPGSQSSRSPFRPVPVSLSAHRSCLAPPLMARTRPKAAAGFPAVCACTVALIGSFVELLTAQRQTVKSCSFQPKPMFARIRTSQLGSCSHCTVSRTSSSCCSLLHMREFKSSRCNCFSINRQTHERLRGKNASMKKRLQEETRSSTSRPTCGCFLGSGKHFR